MEGFPKTYSTTFYYVVKLLTEYTATLYLHSLLLRMRGLHKEDKEIEKLEDTIQVYKLEDSYLPL